MAIVVRPVGYTGSTQQLTWALGNNVPVTAYLWGGGGGGGGRDSSLGGAGGGGGYAQVNFVINEGDVLEVGVGGKGGAGGSSAGGAPGGSAGESYTASMNFNTRDAVSSPPVYPQFNSAYCTFLNTYGVWENPTTLRTFDRTYTVNFPTTQVYQFTCAADNAAQFFIDGVERFYTDSYTSPFYLSLEITAGNHTIRILGTNTGGPGAVALTIDTGLSFGGGRGGNAGGSGSSGGGGGGGGATVVILNGTPLGAAGGGGGGGGGGNQGAATGQSAPGDRGQAAVGTYAGQNGSNKPGDGGGAGGGGGGWGGGEGGTTPGGDTGGYAGSFGLSTGNATADPVGRTPGGTSNPYWRGAGQGGTERGDGVTGYAVFEFDVSGIFVHVDGVFNPVNEVYVKANGIWNQVKAAFIKQSGQWEPILGSTTPAFENVPNKFGTNPREAIPGQGGGGGGCKIICQKLAEMGFFDSVINDADQQFGILLRDQDPDAYNGYLRWAGPVVELLEGKGSVTFRKIVFFWGRNEEHRQQIQSSIVAHYLDVIARPWAEEMAYRMNAQGYNKSNPAGRFIMNIGLPLCRSIGRFGKHTELPMWLKTALIWGITTVLLVAVSAISGTDKLFSKIRRLFKRG